ncbi:MAG: NADPH:quinone oxidoreductase family protein [Thermoleophilaceae bacterium]
MRALQVESLDGPAATRVVDAAEPSSHHQLTPGSGVVIDVHAAGVSFPDVLLTRGRYQVRMEPPFIPGLEVAGVVREATDDIALEPGQRVAGFTFIGGLAERAVAPGFMTFPLPDALSFAEGAGLVLNYHTAYFALKLRASLRDGESVLVHGAAGGVGTAALQVARALGARAIGVVSSDEKERVARAAGADEVVRSDGDWRTEARELTGGEGVDVVLDPVGGERFTDSLRSLATGGRIAVVGFTEGSIPEVKVNRLLLANTSVVGAAWGGYVMTRHDVEREIGVAVNEMAAAGQVKPYVGATHPLEQSREALESIEQRRALGKVVVELKS